MSDKFYIGLDLGQAADYTALAIVERLAQIREQRERVISTKLVTEDIQIPGSGFRREARQVPDEVILEDVPGKPLLHVRYLERFPLGTAYPVIVERVSMLMIDPRLNDPHLVVDATGVGAPVCDMLRQAGLGFNGVTITGGNAESGYNPSSQTWGVPKRDLVGGLQVTLQTGRLKFADGLPEIPAMIKELLAFQVKISASGHDSYEAWREGAHDDMVLALALAIWQAERGRAFLGV